MNRPSFSPDFSHQDHHHSKSGRNSRIAQILFILAAVGLITLYRNRPQFSTLGITFVSIVLEAFPFMLFGAMMGGFVEVFISKEKISRWLPEQHWWSVLIAAGLGVIFPVCECAIVPVVRRLLKKKVPLGAAVAFLLGGPIVNPLVAASTAVAYYFDWLIVVYRLVFGYLIAVAVGLCVTVFFTDKQVLRPNAASGDSALHEGDFQEGGHSADLKTKLAQAVGHAAHDFLDIGRFLIIGAFVAGLVQTLVPRQAFSVVMSVPFLSILIMMGLAIVLNLCSEADAFVAASFRFTPVPLSAQLAFMVLGPMLDIKLLIMYLTVFRKRAILLLAGLTLSMVYMSMLMLEMMIL